jgi:ubiquinone/menaquinone biosynthesis C-methylase UbiE
MADPLSGKLQIWDGWAPALVAGAAMPERDRPLPPFPRLSAEHLFREETWYRPRTRELPEAFSLQWFLEVENVRHGRQGHWVPRLLEVAKHGGETLLGLGNGLGTDWVRYARNGAHVIACCPSAEYLALIQRNFELRGLRGKFLHVTPTELPLDDASIDVACVSGLLGDVENPAAVVAELYRVLKPGGKVLAVAPARYDVEFWHRFWQPWRRLLPTPSSPPRPRIRYSARGLRRLFGKFVEHRTHKRLLRRGEVPHLWRWFPLPLLERTIGRALILKAFKPLSAAMSVPLAA